MREARSSKHEIRNNTKMLKEETETNLVLTFSYSNIWTLFRVWKFGFRVF
jgi:hypothetical protein